MKLKAMTSMMTLRLLLSDWLRRTLGVASRDHGEGESDKSPLCRGHFANDTSDLLPTCYGLVVADLLATSRSTGKLWGNWCNGFWA